MAIKSWSLRGDYEWDFMTGNLLIRVSKRDETGKKTCYILRNVEVEDYEVPEGGASPIMELRGSTGLYRDFLKVFATTVLKALKGRK